MRPTHIYALHAAYWASFGLWSVLRRRERALRAATAAPAALSPAAPQASGAPPRRSREADLWLRVQMVAFFVIYCGLGNDVISAPRAGVEPAYLVPPLRALAAALVAADLAFVAWA